MSRFGNMITNAKDGDLENFVSTHKVDRNLKPATEKQITQLEEALGVKVGKQFRSYLLAYGSLSYNFIELLGISGAEAKPKLITDTLFLRKHGTNVPKNMIPVYKAHDEGLYDMVDENDDMYMVDVYHYFKGGNKPNKIGLKFNNYVVKLFSGSDGK